MNEVLEFLDRQGTSVLFAAVFVEQIGVPLPAAPWLLAAGALAGAGKMNWAVALSAATFAALLVDLIWFYLGRHRGQSVLNLLCRISLEPDSCVRRTENLFTRYGMRGVVAAKFSPGLSTLAPPLAGHSDASTSRFIFFDGLGSLLYLGCFILVGVLFSRQLEQIFNALANVGLGALGAVVGLAALYIGYKYRQRQRLLGRLRMARITVDELHQKQEAVENPIVLDLRSQLELEEDSLLIRSALHMTMDEEQLHRKGIPRVRPLLGGINAWMDRNYPTELRVIGVTRPEYRFAESGTPPADPVSRNAEKQTDHITG